MASTFLFSRPLNAPTAISHGISARFLSSDQLNLIAARNSTLDIYSLSDETFSANARPLIHSFSFALFGNIASLIAIRLPGRSTDSIVVAYAEAKMAVLHFDPASNDLVTVDTALFDEVKPRVQLSLGQAIPPKLILDPLHRCFSLLCFGIYLVVFPMSGVIPTAAIQPGHSGAILKSFAINLSSIEIGNTLSNALTHQQQLNNNTLLINKPIQNVKDIEYLQGYSEPAILLLIENEFTWEGRYAVLKNSIHLLTISLNLTQSSWTLINESPIQIEQNSYRILPIPEPNTGAFILSTNLIYHFNNSSVDFALSTNENGERDNKIPFHLEKSSCICQLDNAAAVLFGSDQFILSNRIGELLLLKFQSQGPAVRFMKLDRLGPSAPAHTLIHLPSDLTGNDRNYLALLSSRAPSLLFDYGRRDFDELQAIREAEKKKNDEEEEAESKRQQVSAEENNESAAKRQRVDEIVQSIIQQQPAAAGDELFDELYGAPTAADREADRLVQRMKDRLDREAFNYDYKFSIADELFSLAVIADFDVAHQFKQTEETQAELLESDRIEEEERKELKDAQTKEAEQVELQERSEEQRKKDQDALKLSIIQQQEREESRDRNRRTRVIELVSASGSDENSVLAAANDGIVPIAITTQPLDKRAYGVWTVKSFEPAAKRRARERKSAKRRQSQGLEFDSGAADYFHSYLLFATASGTELLKTGVEVAETNTEESHLLSNCRTVAAANMLGDRCIAQVHRVGIRLIVANQKVYDFQLAKLIDEDKLHIARAQIDETHILLHLSDATIRLICVSEELLDDESETAGEIKLECNEPKLAESDADHPITAAALYTFLDRSQLFTAATVEAQAAVVPVASASNSVTADAPVAMDEMDDLERLLAGGGDVESAAKEQLEKESLAQNAEKAKRKSAAQAEKIQLAIIARCGMVEIYRLPEFELLFRCEDFLSGTKILTSADVNQSPNGFRHDEEPTTPTTPNINPATPGTPRSPSSVASASSLNRSSSGGSSSGDLLQFVSEICFVSLGSAHPNPALFAFLSSGDLVVYQSFRFVDESKYPIRFQRINQNLIFRPLLAWQPHKSSAFPHLQGRLAPSRDPSYFGPRFQIFTNLSGRTALFIGGFKPVLAFAERGLIRIHEFNLVDWENQLEDKPEERPEELDEFEDSVDSLGLIHRSEPSETLKKKVRAGVASVTGFHNVSCDHGFIYIDTAGFLHICELPPPVPLPLHKVGTQFLRPYQPELASVYNRSVHFDCEFSLRLVPLFAKVHLIARHATTGCWVVIVSKPVKLPSLELETERSVPIFEDRYELLLYSGKKFEVIGRFDDFEPHETVMSLNCIKINGISYIAIGTANQQGEDIACKGRIILLEAYYAMGFTMTEGSVRLLKLRSFAQREKGAVCGVGEICGLVMTAVNNKILLYEYDGQQMTARAFIDVQLFVVSAVVIKNFILIADVTKNVQIALWDPLVKQLTLLGKSVENTESTACEALIDGKSLNLLSSDADYNIQLFRYQPLKLANVDPVFQSSHSQKLLTKADFHVGELITKMRKIRLRTRGGAATEFNKPSSLIVAPVPLQFPKTAGSRLQALQGRSGPLKSIVLASTRAGNYYSFSPVEELIFRRLSSLYTQMCLFIPQYSSLQPRSHRAFKTRVFQHSNNKKNVLDAQLLYQYLSLDSPAQIQLAKVIGTYPEQIIDNLLQIQWALAMH